MHGSLEPLYPLVAAGDEHLIPRLNYGVFVCGDCSVTNQPDYGPPALRIATNGR